MALPTPFFNPTLLERISLPQPSPSCLRYPLPAREFERKRNPDLSRGFSSLRYVVVKYGNSIPIFLYSNSMGTKPIARLMRASWRHGFQGDQDCPRCSVTRTRFALSDIYSLRAGSKWWLARKWPLTCGDAARMLAPDYRHPCIPAKWRKFTPREYEKE